MKAPKSHLSRGFTLIELMLSTAVIALLMLLFISMVDQTSRIWSRTSAKISQFQATRAAFDAMTRTLSQATLNTYWQSDPPKPTTAALMTNWSPSAYARASDLHFVSGLAKQADLIGGTETVNPTHTVFFQAPLGTTSQADPGNANLRKYDRLDNLLTAVGYYLEWGPDKSRPKFLDDMTPKLDPRYRFRLMEVKQESEDLALYGMASAGAAAYKPTDWIKAALGKQVGSWAPAPAATGTGSGRLLEARVMAENIVALIILPKTSTSAATTTSANRDLSPKYRYDSRPTNGSTLLTWADLSKGSYATERQWFNQLPPVVEVTMVAIDELSAQRFNNSTPPDWAVGLFTDATKLEDDLKALETKLQTAKVNYRVFSTDVVIRGSKWTRPEK